MVKGVGIDIIEIDRVKKVMENRKKFLARVFTENEQKYCLSRAKPHLHFAARFAAKEAVLKALGTGFRGVKLTEMEIRRNSLGKPYVVLSGNALSLAKEKGINDILISLSISRENAIAYALALGENSS